MARKKTRKSIHSNGNAVHPREPTIPEDRPIERETTELSLRSVSDTSGEHLPRIYTNTRALTQDRHLVPPNKEPAETSSGSPPSVIVTSVDTDSFSLSSSVELHVGNTSPDPGKLSPNSLPEDPPTVFNNGWKKIRQIQTQKTVVRVLQESPKPKKKLHRHLPGTKKSIPILPVEVASVMLALNIIFPGLGTVVSAFTFWCCAETYDEKERPRDTGKIIGLMSTNLLVGVSQLFTVTFLLVGWFWSISWGVLMVQLAKERKNDYEENMSDISEIP